MQYTLFVLTYSHHRLDMDEQSVVKKPYEIKIVYRNDELQIVNHFHERMFGMIDMRVHHN